jgi:hypothetical protein
VARGAPHPRAHRGHRSRRGGRALARLVHDGVGVSLRSVSAR